MSISYYFNLWKNKVKMFREYDQWCQLHEDEINENIFARENGLDSIHWCWNCKYHECDIH